MSDEKDSLNGDFSPSLFFDSISLDLTHYYLMNKDEVLLRFSVTNSLDSKYNIIRRYDVDCYNPFRKMTNDQFTFWLDNRAIPTNREHLDKLLASLNLTDKERFNLLKLNHGCSLNDTFWIKEVNEKNLNGEDLTFKDVSLYRGFKEHLGLITFFGNTDSLGGRIRTPEVTTQGMLRKAWRVIDEPSGKSIYLYKAGTYGFSNSGNENYSEVLAYEIAKLLGLNCVKYELDKWDGIDCCRSKLFTSEKVGYYSMSSILALRFGNSVKWTYSMVSSMLGDEHKQELNDMMVFDFIIENQDRHFGNFGLMIDNDSGEVLGLSPILDNGYSLLNFETSYTFDDYDYYKSSIGTFGIPNISQATEIIKGNPRRYKHWAKTIMSHLDCLEVKGVPVDRVQAVKKLVTLRCKYIQTL